MNSGANTDREVNKLVKQYYEIMAYQSFANHVLRNIESETKYLTTNEEKTKKANEWIKKTFSNRLLILILEVVSHQSENLFLLVVLPF